MIDKIGIGIDLVKVSMFNSLPYDSNKNFYTKIFTNSEIKYCLKFSNPYQHFSGKFAIKEAVQKSILDKIPILHIITDHKNSIPTVKIKNNQKYSFKISLSHEDEYAVAVVISEKI
ncbi:4'-phosphopantetheinyl transferase superfamily protein [Nitrosarchaeum sp.]|uniref:holo-ACP synthase n=1 Tax=Nitrosarchaeum sp. TaxID=2026886 RepID=UPI00247BD3D4|nr:4'-phosphopantetheinyl transferase superfamily protein [Nitrosarchaeum sp.]MCV0411897.1 4'-phosphopantetheinyl transferase superfamily protein [Nitrosarchaeum sp.]